MHFKTLGTLEASDGHTMLTPSAPKQRSVLCLLLTTPNEVVSTGAFFEELWDNDPPASAQTTLQTYVYQLRKRFGAGDPVWAAENMLVTRHGGYTLLTPEDGIDVTRFETLVAAGRSALDGGRLELASRTLRAALALWRGPALVDVTAGPRLETHRVRLEEARIHAIKMKIKAEMTMGNQQQVVGELRELVATYPLNEWFHHQLMLALSRTGRRQEALEVYHNLRRVLIDELGIEPNYDMRDLQQGILCADAV
ncbi:AfsR/SARP family transcriptional regulator [Actinomadura algeriensis]|uniref:DNA-binding SARP family transcriptional activator n=1 Tax=Actinomadura algeriensis TaxID=1679523 RepID=A0ABR9JIW3_9ACTN|nr:AfsR/SARP family transcriptional regulator [Actinomadura algeriensis]MBE1530495.1 DNA-binding SARP family transcriptional activator [Actinomadura algeriensis]